jgi:hypothetical protein
MGPRVLRSLIHPTQHKAMSYPQLHKARIFRETHSVYFADAWIPGQNGLDVVTHYGPAVSPPYLRGEKQFYVHTQQTDFNRVVFGERVFELVYPDGGHFLVHLNNDSGALEIPAGVYHRSVSCSTGSVLLNQAVRTPQYDENNEFHPRTPKSDEVLLLGSLKPMVMVGDTARILELIATYDHD